MEKITMFTAWDVNGYTVKNYGGPLYRIFKGEKEVDVFTLYNENILTIERIILEHIESMEIEQPNKSFFKTAFKF